MCIICNKEFSVPLCRSKSAKVCSIVCRNKYKIKYSKKLQTAIVNCENCGIKFKRYKSHIVGMNQYCSRKCANEGKTINIFECEVCGKTFTRPVNRDDVARFCSKTCAYKQLKIERNPINTECSYCHKPLHRMPSLIKYRQKNYCSIECKSKGESINLIDIPINTHIYSRKNWKILRNEILRRDKYKCTKCENATTQLHVHHIKRRNDGGVDVPSNLITLCRSCHKKTDGRLY